MDYDVIVAGAGFAGLAAAHHLPRETRVLIVDAKPRAGSSVESTGLITRRTREEFAEFFEIDKFITNPIDAICVVAPGFDEHFISQVDEPWIFQTDTRGLVANLAACLPMNVELKNGTAVTGVTIRPEGVTVQLDGQNGRTLVSARLLIGADGGRSRTAELSNLSRNSKFLFGYERVLPGHVLLGGKPESTIYHFWFGEFSLGYGGWLSPTALSGRPAFRVGLAKLMRDRGEASALTDKFLGLLKSKHILDFDPTDSAGAYMFGGLIPIGGVLPNTARGPVVLIGDAAGYCGAFAADGIKGAVISGKEVAKLAQEHLNGDHRALERLPGRMRKRGLLEYYRRQLRYRLIWDLMRRDRTFRSMYDIIAAEKESFLDQFCDSKDKRKSLMRIVLKPRHVGKLLKYAGYLIADMVPR